MSSKTIFQQLRRPSLKDCKEEPVEEFLRFVSVCLEQRIQPTESDLTNFVSDGVTLWEQLQFLYGLEDVNADNQQIFFHALETLASFPSFPRYSSCKEILQWQISGTIPPIWSRNCKTRAICSVFAISLTLLCSRSNLLRVQRLLELVEFPNLKYFVVRLEGSPYRFYASPLKSTRANKTISSFEDRELYSTLCLDLEEEKDLYEYSDPVTSDPLLYIPIPASSHLCLTLIENKHPSTQSVQLVPLCGSPPSSNFGFSVCLAGSVYLSSYLWTAPYIRKCSSSDQIALLSLVNYWKILTASTMEAQDLSMKIRLYIQSKFIGGEMFLPERYKDKWYQVVCNILSDPYLTTSRQFLPLLLLQFYGKETQIHKYFFAEMFAEQQSNPLPFISSSSCFQRLLPTTFFSSLFIAPIPVYRVLCSNFTFSE